MGNIMTIDAAVVMFAAFELIGKTNDILHERGVTVQYHAYMGCMAHSANQA
jgi:hypothetical protein